jgi:hypothetical protein
MKKILFIILIILAYSCCTSKSTNKAVKTLDSIESPKPEPKPEPRPEPTRKIYKMTAPDSNYDVERDKVERDRVERERNVPVQDGTVVRNLHIGNRTTAALINKVTSFDKGDINYVIQDTMIVGVINEVNVTISKGVDIKTIIADVKTFTENNLHTDTIRIAPVMRARIVDPSNGINFIIASKTNAEQFLEIGDYTRWTWDVTPLNKGKNKLSLIVDVMYGTNSKSYQVYDGFIYVYSNETFFQKITKFLSKNWQFILSSLLIPFSVFLYNRYKKKK